MGRNTTIAIVVLGIMGFFILAALSNNSGTEANEEILRLESCLDEYRRAYKEQSDAMDEAYFILDNWSGGYNSNQELSAAINEALRYVDDRELNYKVSLYCD